MLCRCRWFCSVAAAHASIAAKRRASRGGAGVWTGTSATAPWRMQGEHQTVAPEHVGRGVEPFFFHGVSFVSQRRPHARSRSRQSAAVSHLCLSEDLWRGDVLQRAVAKCLSLGGLEFGWVFGTIFELGLSGLPLDKNGAPPPTGCATSVRTRCDRDGIVSDEHGQRTAATDPP
jgi:hypothetical protein